VSSSARKLLRQTRLGAICLLAWTLASCATVIERQRPPPPAVYDLGPSRLAEQPGMARPVPGTFVVPSVRPPAWLDTTAMLYRLLYEDAARPQAYSLSRWAAEPALLFTDRLRARLSAASGGVVTPGYGARVDYAMHAELDDFSQHFDAPGESRVVVAARITLLTGLERKLLGQRVFSVQRPAAPDAAGAARAFAGATDQLIDELLEWTAQLVKEAPAGRPVRP
jgi:cholesterol transport system auxiliary component